MPRPIPFLILLAGLFFNQTVFAQKTASTKKQKKNTNIFSKPDPKKLYNPSIATYRSAILPGWGQLTNKTYWKIPIVYAALGITAAVFFSNVNQFNEAKRAYTNASDGDPTNDYLIPSPYFAIKDQPERIKNFRNQVRQNVDYSALFFILFWGLNVVDATVEAHLKTFDVSDDLTLQIKGGYSPMANTNGVSLVLNIGKHRTK